MCVVVEYDVVLSLRERRIMNAEVEKTKLESRRTKAIEENTKGKHKASRCSP